ncbi:membrane protein [Corynebacterium phage Bran]|nr:membrane protein [Corynebacterium phage Bran]
MTTFITTLLDVTGLLLLVAILWELRTMPRVRVEIRRITPKKTAEADYSFSVLDTDEARDAFHRAMRHLDREDGRR